MGDESGRRAKAKVVDGGELNGCWREINFMMVGGDFGFGEGDPIMSLDVGTKCGRI